MTATPVKNMCGIIGYTGMGDALPKMTKGLSVLEYRGYDSVGVALQEDGEIKTVKCRGRIGDLEERLGKTPSHARCAIGHTRWATHGGPSDVNAHPHRIGKTVLVHNGIIENHKQLKERLINIGVEFSSETDTEVAAALLDLCYRACHDPVKAIRRAMEELTGSYAFGILFDDAKGEVFAVRSGSPLILAKGEDGYYLASDMTALLPFTNLYYPLKEGEIARLTPTKATLFDDESKEHAPTWEQTDMTAEAAQKGGFAHFMLKEIFEQPKALMNAISSRIDANGLPDFSADGIPNDFWKRIKHVQIVACGSAMHAGLIGARMIEDYATIPTGVYIASEYRYHPPVTGEGTLVIVVSQSGETADSLAALRYAKSVGLPTLGIVNAVGTTIAREADYCIYTYAGPEIAVATTKGYCTQVAVLYLIALHFAKIRQTMNPTHVKGLLDGLRVETPHAIAEMLTQERMQDYRRIAQVFQDREHAFYIGRGRDYLLSLEGALKLKEISYVHTEAYASGELKHGTISLIEKGTPVIALCTDRLLLEKAENNVHEVESRGAHVIRIYHKDCIKGGEADDDTIVLNAKSDIACFFSAMIAVQMIAYETAAQRGCDIDRPRNLAKSVTVE